MSAGAGHAMVETAKWSPVEAGADVALRACPDVMLKREAMRIALQHGIVEEVI